MSQAERIQTPYLAPEDDFEVTLRPRRLEEFVGQPQLKAQLEVAIEAARGRGEALDHVLLAGPPGLGKTSLAQIIAAELEVPFVQTAGPALERKGDIAAFLTSLEPRSVFFVDEIHRLPRALEETFYPAMEDRRLPITVGQGAGARVFTLELPPFTLIGATTRAGLLTTPLRDRFGIPARLEPYSSDDLAAIVTRAARILGVELDPLGAEAIAKRSRGTPRVANRLLKRARDYAEVRGGGSVTVEAANAALELLEVDQLGLDRLDRECSARSASASRAARWGSPRSRSRSARSATRSRTSTSPTCSSSACSSGPRAGGSRPCTPTRTSSWSRRRSRRRCSDPVVSVASLVCARERARASGAGDPPAPVGCQTSMSHPFICPNCGERSLASDRYEAFRREDRGCAHCGFSFLFELLDDYYPAPDAAFFVADREGRVIGCGRGSFELTGYEEEEVVGQPLTQALDLRFENGEDHVGDGARMGRARAGQDGDAANRLRYIRDRHGRPLSGLR